MFGIGLQEMVIIGVLFLIIFGPDKLPSMARDLGRFVNEARRYKDQFQSKLVSGAEDEPPEHEKTFEVAIKEGKMTPDEITVDEGDEVTLWISSDSLMHVHLNGYYLAAGVKPGEPLDLPFDATISGRFEIEDHSSDPREVLGALLVEPQ